jgi:hypothetical protein
MAEEHPKGSFVRWQTVTIGQLTYAVNLILGFAVATLGFQVTLLLNEKFVPVSWQKCAFALSLVLLSVSILLGIAVVINRLRDFRATMRAARLREQGTAPDALEEQRTLYRRLGAITWNLFWWQLGTFSAGIALAVLSVLASAIQKLL